MRKSFVAEMSRKMIGTEGHTQRVSAVVVILCLLLPVASPIPAYAWTLNLPKPKTSEFGLFAPTANDDSWTTDFFSKLLAGPAAFIKPSKTTAKSRTVTSNPKSLAARVSGFETEIEKRYEYKVGEILSLATLPVDKEGNVVNGLSPKWSTEDDEIVRMVSDTEAIAARPGTTTLNVTIGERTERYTISVRANETPTAFEPYTDPDEVGEITDTEAATLLTVENNVGNQVGLNELASKSTAAAMLTSENLGSSNYSFSVPVASLPGRGIDARVGITYNSRMWSKSGTGSSAVYKFNPNENWLAPGFEIGYGNLTPIGPTTSLSGYLLTGPDGGRHELKYSTISGGWKYFEANDGTFIQAKLRSPYATTSNLVVRYTDGTSITYGSTTTSGKRFPVQIKDRNGNFLTIAYVSGDSVGKISYIQDTLNRYVTFHYENASPYRLVAVSVPGYDGSTDSRKTIRFYYDSQSLASNSIFDEGTVDAPSSFTKLKYVYFPGTSSGYRYDYSEYSGSISKISQLRGMTVSGVTSETAMGSVSSEGTAAATTEYNYPATAQELTDVPTFTQRTDKWKEGDSGDLATAYTDFDIVRDVESGCEATFDCDGTSTTTITSPDETNNITVSKVHQGFWDDGLIQETRIETGTGPTVWSKTKFYWEQGDGSPGGRANPRLNKIEVTNDAGQTRQIEFGYDEFNNQTAVIEYDFDEPGGPDPVELRRTVTEYEDGSGWLANRLLRLPTQVTTVVGSDVISKVKYFYDDYTSPNGLVNASGVVHHDTAYNPHTTATHSCNCHWECPGEGEYQPESQACPGPAPAPTPEWICETCSNYDSATDFRGNVTKVISFPDTSNTDTDTENPKSTFTFDITGNVVASSSSCCTLKTTEYSSTNYFAYPTSQTRSGGSGLELVTGATYDFNTGLLMTSTDENERTTSITYREADLRVDYIEGPDESRKTMAYNDSAYPYHVQTTVKLDSSHNVSSWAFADGRGLNFRNRTQTGSSAYLSSDVEFDPVGRAVKSYNPYTVSSLSTARPSGIDLTAITERDGLGRTLETTLTDGTTVTASYDGVIATVTDQALKTRRQIADALGRIIRVDEPNSSGVLGDVGTPNQPTYYEYDWNDNLIKVTQTDTTTTPNVTQERKFQYDALSRLTHEKQVEATATLNDAGTKVSSGGLWTGFYEYDSDNLLEFGIDARGVKTLFTYDGLNRITDVEYQNETGYTTPEVHYTYSEEEEGFYNAGRLTKVETDANTTYGIPATVQNYRYDVTGNVVKHNQSIGSESYLQEYTYNLAGQLTSQKYPSGKTVEYEVDNFGRLSTVADADREYVTSVSFDTKGLLSQLNLGNGDHETFSYNDRLQMTSQSLLQSTTVLQKYDYGYGEINSSGVLDPTKNNGQLGTIDGYIDSSKQWTQKFLYDSVGRLKQAAEYRSGNDSYLTYKQVFDYDRFGNLYRKAANNGTSGQEDPLPYTAIEESSSPTTGDIDKATNRFRTDTTYNEAGMVTADEKFRDMEFAYDANGRMVRATKDSTPDAETVYDALGNRVASKVNDVWRFMIYDAFGKLTAEYGQAEEGVGGVSYIQQDWQGSVRTVTNSLGYVTSRNDHTAFGEAIGSGVGLRASAQGYIGSSATRQGYGLTERDEGTRLDHTWFRKNEGSAGRWTSPDPYKPSARISSPQSFNRLTYAENDPTNFVDPTGLLTYPDGPYDPVLYARGLLGGLAWVLATGAFFFTYHDGSRWSDDPSGFKLGPISGFWFFQSDLLLIIRTALQNTPALIATIQGNRRGALSDEVAVCHAAQESGLLPNATGFAGEIGLFQVKPSTGRAMWRTDGPTGSFSSKKLYDPAINTRIGTAYLDQLYRDFGNNLINALGAYKQGAASVKKDGLTPASQKYAEEIDKCADELIRTKALK